MEVSLEDTVQKVDSRNDKNHDHEDAQETSTSDAASSNNNNNKSSFFLLNQTHGRSIPQVKVELENLTYRPVTSTANAHKGGHSKGSEKERTVVLDKITTQLYPYQLTAWMGPSGSGKTSLTNVVAGLIADRDAISGTQKVNGSPGRLPKQMVGVVWQDDLLLSNLTVEETIYFGARLKTPSDIADAQVRSLVEEAMNELNLLHIRDRLIGSPAMNLPGISGGERKRVAVAAELVVRPSLLVLDEPTSGLDATTAYSLMTTLKQLAGLGHSIAVVIHQPRTDIFKLIDHLLLLSKGRVVYNGEAACARQYLETIPDVGELPPETGIADWIMDTIIADENRPKRVLADYWEKNPKSIMEGCSESVPSEKHKYQRMSTLTELHETPKKYEASFLMQLALLTGRTLKQRRGERLTRVSMLLTFSYVFFTSFFWWQLPDTTAYVFERNSLLFFMLIAQGNGIVMGSISVFQKERALLSRERAKKLYGVLPFFLAKASSDMTNNVLLPVLYGIITYWTAGLRPTFVHFLKFVLGYYLTLSSAQSMGFFLSILIPNTNIAMILAPPITLFFFIIGGFYIPLSNMHVGIKWASYISFARYGYSGLLVNEFEGRFVPCADDDAAISIGASDECPMPGDSVYESVGIDGIFASYWFNISILFILQVTFLIGAYGLLRRSQ
jgi:ABC-type multidrug transport system ATPase subunit